jgi:replicative DNA helicase
LTDFDEACGGFPDTGVVLLGATTSSGKSVMAKQIGLNMVRSYMGMRVSMVTLEMSREQEFTRTMSNLAEIDGQQLARNNLTDDERAYLEQVALEFANECGKNNSAIDVWSPDEDDVGIDACLRHFKATGARVGMIDYTGLLAGEAGAETQAISLSMIVRKAKVFSKRTNKLIVLLVQVDDKSHALRYAQAMREHADVLAVWFPNEAEKLLGQWMVYIKKNRHSVIGKFPTTWDMKYSKVVASGKYRPGDVSEELLAGGESDAAEDEDSKKSSSARAARVSNAGAYSGAKGAK